MSDEWMPDDDREPRKREPFLKSETDFVKITLATADAARIVDRVVAAFMSSQEIDDLRNAYENAVSVELQVSSSNKYTRFKFPNVRHLGARIRTILVEERCDLIGGGTRSYGEDMEVCVPRLGNCHLVVRYGEEKE